MPGQKIQAERSGNVSYPKEDLRIQGTLLNLHSNSFGRAQLSQSHSLFATTREIASKGSKGGEGVAETGSEGEGQDSLGIAPAT